MREESPKTTTGLDQNIAGALCYLLGWVTGLVFYLIEKDNPFIRYHAMQSIWFGAAWTVLWIVFSLVLSGIPGWVGWVIGTLLWTVIALVGFVLWIVLMVKAYQGQTWRLPIIGDMAARTAKV